jgi:hypothetical protein
LLKFSELAVTRHFGSLALGRRVTNQATDIDTNLFSGVDLRAFWETLRLRWWVIPAVIAVAVGLLWAQESDLRTEPAGYFVSRTYEARDPTAVLASVGIDPVSVRAFPDVNNQILILQSGEIRSEVSRLIGEDIPVTIVRNRPTFSLIDTLESDGQSSFIFQSAGVPTYSFSCTGAVRNLCDKAIDAYVSKAVELRTESFRAGLEDLKAILLRIDQSSEDASITTKILALNELLSRLETPLTQIGRYEDTIGATITSVRRPTYRFGIGAGVIVALLILLQLTFSDRRVRSARQLSQLAPAALLGVLPPKRDSVRDRRAAVSIQHSVVRHHATKIRFIPLREVLDDSSAIDRLSAMLTATTYVSLPFAGLSVPEITQPATGEIDVIIVRRNLDLRTDVVEARIALESSGRILAGVLFVG